MDHRWDNRNLLAHEVVGALLRILVQTARAQAANHGRADDRTERDGTLHSSTPFPKFPRGVPDMTATHVPRVDVR
ncbi:Hypothetical protein A7982_01577 [Minicystis rosea]|nr:Hypothetical protein A7982_01577 [Minicystis rosea]